MLWKCCTQYASKYGKLSSGHRTGKGQFSFQSQRKAMPKNVQKCVWVTHSCPPPWKPMDCSLPGSSVHVILQARILEWVAISSREILPTQGSNPCLLLCRWIFFITELPGKHYFTSMWDECNCAVVWAFSGIAFLWGWNENTLSSPVATAEFSKFAGILSAALSEHHLLGFEIAQLEFHHLH